MLVRSFPQMNWSILVAFPSVLLLPQNAGSLQWVRPPLYGMNFSWYKYSWLYKGRTKTGESLGVLASSSAISAVSVLSCTTKMMCRLRFKNYFPLIFPFFTQLQHHLHFLIILLVLYWLLLLGSIFPSFLIANCFKGKFSVTRRIQRYEKKQEWIQVRSFPSKLKTEKITSGMRLL